MPGRSYLSRGGRGIYCAIIRFVESISYIKIMEMLDDEQRKKMFVLEKLWVKHTPRDIFFIFSINTLGMF